MSSRTPVSALDPFFEILRANHFGAGLDRRLRVLEALTAWQGEFPPGRLRTLLCPIFATNSAEQRLFYELFDQHFPKFSTLAVTSASVEPGHAGTVEGPAGPHAAVRWPARAAISLILAAAVALVALCLWRLRSPDLPALARWATGSAPVWSLARPYVPPDQNAPPRVPPNKDHSTVSYSYGFSENPASPGIQWRWSVLLFVPVALWLLVEAWAWVRRKAILARGVGGSSAARAFRRMVLPVRAAPAGFAATLRKLRRPSASGGVLRLHVSKTVAATVRAAGLPELRYEPVSRRPEYLVLIDRSSVRDHQATLFEERVTELDRRGLRIAAYTFAGDPRVCRNLKSGRSVYLADLLYRTADHRLIFFGEGDRLVSDWGELAPAAGILSHWHHRCILTPRPPSTWGPRELHLARHFLLLPATIESLAASVDYFDPDHSARLRHPESEFSHNELDWDRATPAQIEQSLGDRDLYLWLCACALYPQLQWDVTLHLALKINPRVLTESNIERLVRLPWFRRGSIPVGIQQALAESLDRPARLRLRAAILELLEQAPAEAGSAAAEAHRLEIAVQQLDILPAERRGILDDEAVAQVVNRREVPKFALVLSPAARKALFPYGLPALGFRLPARRAMAMYAGAVVFIAAGWFWWSKQQEYLAQGDVLLNVGRYADARPHYEQAHRLNPLRGRASLGIEIVKLADLRRDEVAFDQRLGQLRKEWPNDSHLKLLEGDYLLTQNRVEEAMRHYQDSVKLNPGLAEAYLRMGVLYDRQRNPRMALQMYQRAVDLSPSSPQYRANLADQYFKRGEYDRAIGEYAKVDQFPLAALELARIYRLMGELGTAREKEGVAIDWLASDAVMALPENQLPWSFELSQNQGVTISSRQQKLCYARLELSATLYLQGQESPAAEQSKMAKQACGSQEEDVKRVIDRELARLANERDELAAKAQAFRRSFLVLELGHIIVPAGAVNRRFEVGPGTHEISASVYDSKGKLVSPPVTATVNVPAPMLYVVAVGLSHYRDRSLDQGVKFAASDAEALINRLQEQGQGFFREVKPYPLYNEKATRNNIEYTINQVASQIQSTDVFVLYLSGHGTALDGQYYFIPWDVRYTSQDGLQQQSLDQETIRSLLARISAKKTLLLLDTCSAGAFSPAGRGVIDNAAIDRLAKTTGRAILAASASDQMAIEGYQNHSVFAFAVLEGLEKAPADAQGFITVTALADYVLDRVPEITKQVLHYEQYPMWNFTGQTFPIARKQPSALK